MTNLSDISAAAMDDNLRDRLISAAAEVGYPQSWVAENARRLVSLPVTEAGDTIASVYAYAVAAATPPPGLNPAAVTDTYLRAAVAALLTPPTSV